MRKLEKIVLAILLSFVAIVVLFPAHTNCGPSPATAGLSNIKQLGIGATIYCADYDDRYPLSETWMTGLEPYVKNDAMYQVPRKERKDSDAREYGFAFLVSLGGRLQTAIPLPEKQVVLFESTLSGWNATSYFDTAFSRVHPDRVPVAFADGSGKRVLVSNFDRFGRPVSELGLPRYLAGGGVLQGSR